jgi:uncharacterized membrane protein
MKVENAVFIAVVFFVIVVALLELTGIGLAVSSIAAMILADYLVSTDFRFIDGKFHAVSHPSESV